MPPTYAFMPAIWAPLGGAAFLAVIGAYSWRRRDVPGALALSAGALLSVGILLCAALVASAVQPSIKLGWHNLQSALQVLAVTAVTCFALDYTYPGRWLDRRSLALLWLPAALIAALFVFDEGRLFWSGYEISPDGNLLTLPTPLAYSALAFGLALGLVNAVAFLWLFVRSPQHRLPVALMLAGQFAARGLFLLNVVRNGAPLGVDPAVTTALLPFVAYAIALFGFRIFDPLPAARRAVIEQIGTGVVVFDRAGMALDLNPAAERILGLRAAEARGLTWQQLVARQLGPADAAANNAAELSEIVFGSDTTARHYAHAMTPLTDFRGQPCGSVLMLRDVTEQKLAQAQSVEQQGVLATLRERERLARELHDSAGQILAYVSLQAQAIAKCVEHGNTDAAKAQLRRLAQLAQESHKDVRESILSLKAGQAGGWSFLEALDQYLAAYGEQFGICARLTIQPHVDDAMFSAPAGVQLLRVTQEALTNARKHSGARQVRVTVAREKDEGVITIEDDGVGFVPGVEPANRRGDGYGLNFMRERMAEIGGRLRIESTPGAGARVILRSPLATGQAERPTAWRERAEA